MRTFHLPFWEFDVKIEKPLTNQVPGLSTVSHRPCFSTGISGPSAGHKSKRKKQSSVIYNATQHYGVRKIFIKSLGSNRGGTFQMFEFSEWYSEIGPAKLTKNNAQANQEISHYPVVYIFLYFQQLSAQ